jgi:hypothetical protein
MIPERLRAMAHEGCANMYQSSTNTVKKTLAQVQIVGDRFRIAKACRDGVGQLHSFTRKYSVG